MPPDDTEITAEQRLTAELVAFSQSLPGGYQVALGIRLTQAIQAAEELFTTHQLPQREELVAELTLWHCHAEDGLKFLEHSDQLLADVMEHIRTVSRVSVADASRQVPAKRPTTSTKKES